ncbi:MAG TPA: tetratricopeptide repeat protein [Nocardioides sp.]
MPRRDTSWTIDFPPIAALAGRLLGLTPDQVAAHSRWADGLAHVWTPGRGGPHLVAGLDGGAYVRESSFTAAELRAAYMAGQRSDPQRLAGRPVNHAASAVAAMIGVLRGEQPTTATPVGPSQADLEALVGSPLRATTSDEIAERLRSRGDGAWLLVGIDRAEGPGHWVLALLRDGEVSALDPIANTRRAWPPPNADAVRWWADGEPLRPLPGGAGDGSGRRRAGSASYGAALDALDDPASSAERLLAAGHGLRDSFLRFEHGIGLLPPDAFAVMLRAYRAADAAGSREAALTWVRRAYFERVDDLAAAAAERIDRLVADDRDGEAHVLRGWMRFNGWGHRQDVPASVADHETAAARGNADGHFELSVLYGTGQGVPVDPDRAQRHLLAAADADHPRALYNVAASHATGRGLPHDPARALALYRRAGERGHARAAFTAGIMTLTGEGTAPDAAAAGALLLDAQDLGMDVEDALGAFAPPLRDRALAAMQA